MPNAKRSLSIRATLLLWLLPLLVVFMLVAWFIHGALLERMTRDFVQDRLHQEAVFLENQIRRYYPQVDPSLSANPYFEDVLHHAYAIRIGSRTWVSPESLKGIISPRLNQHASGFIQLKSPDESNQDYVAYRKAIIVDGNEVVLLVAEDMNVLNESQADLHVWTAVVAVGLLLVLFGLVLLAVYLALKPVTQPKSSLQQLQRGEQERLVINAPKEFVPLIIQINHLLNILDQRLKRSRDALANLSHSVKTPISVIQQVLEDTDRPMNDELRIRLGRRLSELDRQLESEMRRSQFAGPDAGKHARPIKQVRDLVWMLGRLYRNVNFELDTRLETEFSWPIEEHDFNEIVGNLLDNAGKWAKQNVVVVVKNSSMNLTIAVRDDGPGVPESELDTMGARGLRLDEQMPGHGLGLAIVQDLTSRYQGALLFANGPGGGLSVEVHLPHPQSR